MKALLGEHIQERRHPSFHAVQEFLGITFPPKPHPFVIKRCLYFSLYAPKDFKPGTPFDAGWPPSPLRFFDSLRHAHAHAYAHAHAHARPAPRPPLPTGLAASRQLQPRSSM